MICDRCNKEAGAGAKFCPCCGTPVCVEPEHSHEAGAARFVDGEIVFSDHEVTSGRASSRKCPRCVTAMKVQSREGIEVDVCAECGGVWFDAGELNRLLQKHAKLYALEEIKEIRKTIGPPSVITERVQYVKCPVCGQLMNRTNYGKFSGIIVDKCRDHGIWLDKGEFEKISEFVSKGGLELEKLAKGEEQAAERLRQGSSSYSVPVPLEQDDQIQTSHKGKGWLEIILADLFGFGKW